jgi:hypothetical protein
MIPYVPPPLVDQLFQEVAQTLAPDLGEVALRLPPEERPRYLDPEFIARRIRQLQRYRMWARLGMLLGILATLVLLVAAIFRLALPDYVLVPTTPLALATAYWGYRYAQLENFLFAYRLLNAYAYDALTYKEYRPTLHQVL